MIEKYRFRVDNGKHPYFELDVPLKFGGEDTAPTALEMVIMALATCLGTTYKMIADRMHIVMTQLEVKALANKSDDIHLSDIHLIVNIKSDESHDKLEQCLKLAKENCPVDLIFQQTKIPISTELKNLA